MDRSLRRAELYYLRIIFGAIAGLIVFVGCCWAGYEAYSRWQEHQLMRQAHVFFDQGKFEWAGLAAQKAFSWRSDSVEACQVLADIAERAGRVEALEWRRRAVDIRPDSLPALVALSQTALRFSRVEIAAKALAQVPKAHRDDASYQSAAAHVAIASKHPEEALSHLKEAARLAPRDQQRQLELAQFEIRAKDGTTRSDGRELATRLKEIPETRSAALELLLGEALRAQDSLTAAALAKELAAVANSSFETRLNALSTLHLVKDSSFISLLGQVQAEARESAPKAAALINWMNSNSLAVLAISWSKELPPQLLDNLLVRVALADAYSIMHDWDSLQAMLNRGSWSSAESLQLALKSKVAHETGDEAGSNKYWTQAVEKAQSDVGRLQLLQRLSKQWQWPDKEAKILWLLADNPATQVSALQALYQHYTALRDTLGLYRTFLRLAQVSPGDHAIENNVVQLSLLLNLDRPSAERRAKKLHEAEPQNVAFASTYAFALHQGGDDGAAKRVMQQFAGEKLQDPAIAAYYGIILAANKDNQALRYLDLGAKAPLLPEEESLVAQARKQAAER